MTNARSPGTRPPTRAPPRRPQPHHTPPSGSSAAASHPVRVPSLSAAFFTVPSRHSPSSNRNASRDPGRWATSATAVFCMRARFFFFLCGGLVVSYPHCLPREVVHGRVRRQGRRRAGAVRPARRPPAGAAVGHPLGLVATDGQQLSLARGSRSRAPARACRNLHTYELS